MHTNDYFQERAGVKIKKYCADYAVVGMKVALAILAVAKFIPSFSFSCGS